jgi:Fasciclin domain
MFTNKKYFIKKNNNMKKLNNKMKLYCLAALASILFLTSCNKDLDQLSPIATPTYPSSVTTAGKTLAANPVTNIYYRFVQKAGLETSFDDVTKSFTLFATNNTGMRFFIDKYLASLPPPTTGPPIPVLGAAVSDARYFDTLNKYMPDNTVATKIVNYNTTGYVNGFADGRTKIIPSISPNKVFGSDLFLVTSQPFLRVPFHVASGLPYSYVNNIPVTAVDQIVSNGVIHQTFTLLTPPDRTVKSLVAGESSLVYFRAAIARADANSTGTSKFDSLMNLAVTNMTVLAPNDAAMQPLLKAIIYSTLLAPPYNLSPAAADFQATAASSPAALNSPTAGFNLLPVASVQGIIAYHILASTSTSGSTFLPDVRYFSVNVPSTPAFVKTLVNGSVAAHPGIRAQATYAGAVPSSVTFTGLGTFPPGGVPYSGTAANVVKADLNGVNGVLHIIDGVLLPQ